MDDKTKIKQLNEEMTRNARRSLKAFDFYDDDIPEDLFESDQSAGVPAPPLEKDIPVDAVRIDLPAIDEIDLGTMPLVEVLKKRCSHRDYSPGRANS